MSARSFEHFPTVEEESHQQPPSGVPPLSVVLPSETLDIPDSTPESEAEAKAKRVEEQRHKMLVDFYGFAKEVHNIDPKTADPKIEHDLALVIHGYAWTRATQHIESTQKQAKTDPAYTAPDLRIIDYERINGRVNYHYRQFGEDRQIINRIDRREEELFLTSAKARATAFIYDNKATPSEGANHGPSEGRKGIPRQQRYPEILLVMELREALINDHAFVAAKSAEITFAAYGSIFPALIRERAIHVLNDTGAVRSLIKRIEAAELPKDEQPDKPMPPRKPKS